MKFGNWNKTVIGGMVASLGFVVAFNYLVDPYEIFHTNNFRMASSANERFNKYEFLLKNGDRFDTLIMGSSVMGAYEPGWIESVIPDSKVYNASFLGGLPADAHKILEALGRKNIKPKTVFIGIDLFPFLQAEDSKSPSKSHHFDVTGVDQVPFYSGYLFASSLWHGVNKVRESYDPIPKIQFDINGTGRYYLLAQDAEREKNLSAYTQKTFGGKKISEIRVKNVAWIESRFDELADLKKWGDQSGVDIVFYIHPFHRLLRDNLPDGALEGYRQRIFDIVGPVKDFTGRSSFTDDDNLYYDPKHYIPDVAKKITLEVLSTL